MPRAWSVVSRAGRRPLIALRAARRAIRGTIAEILDAFGIVFGWAAVTYALASFFDRWEIYPFALGLFVLSLVGWKHLATIFSDGMYVLTRDAPKRKRSRGD